MRRIIFCIFLLLLGIYAQDTQALTVSPIRIELDADPGGVVKSEFMFFNEKATTQTYYIDFARFEASDDESGQPKFVPGTDGIPSWINAPTTIVARPKEYEKVEFSIQVPQDAEPGGYFAGAFASTEPVVTDAANAISLLADVGTLILLRVNGDFEEGEAILEFGTKGKQKVFSSLPVEFFYRFQNSGVDRIKPLGDITIKNTFGLVRKIVNSNPGAGNVLPKSIRRFESAWVTSGGGKTETALEAVSPDPNLSFFRKVRWEYQNFALGKYKAVVNLTVNNDASRSYTKSAVFYVFPWHLLLTIFASLALLLIITVAIALVVIMVFFRKKSKK